ncbi:glycoside hydrolase family 3 protein [Neobacillus citreus]|uniref:Glycoside hydrolase family 3 C-terminal domain-containing protein n=1 Tax=Neobacillus citreus TaxID=2833578 RepID=A0A942T3X8_9BACI|nr:glycoside hydrolase family 3 C-terminal domain-containing protein [Neobacillus citreus]MCH6269017.1 glycoside hydrolase family 3 C-terminal domain-containing protein [Neobacillus citreus]
MNNEHTLNPELNESTQSSHRNGNFPWMDQSLSPRERAEKLVAAMTLEQKIAQLHGAMETINIYALPSMEEMNAMSPEEYDKLMAQIQVQRHVKGIEELGIPRFRITNGPVGVGMGDGHPSPPATALPMTIGLAAGFDPELARDYGDIIGSETATLGQHVLEGPGVCLHRTPIAGRNFEYFSEDPYLSGVMGVEVAKAIQTHNVIAMGKHYVVNDQEYERFRANVEVDEHVLRELYLLPFEMLVKDADIAAIMSAYNRVRGTYATENRYLLNDILRDEWGFKGYIQSDFWSCRSTAASLTAGMDHEMPDAKWCNETNVKNALEDTSLEIQTVNRALVRRFTQMFRFGQFERPYNPGVIDAKGHGAISRKIGSQTAVLLKNEGGMLPLDPKAYGTIVIIGQSEFVDDACNGGGGSSKVDPLYTIPPVEGMQEVLHGLGSEAKVSKVTVAKDLSNLEEAKSAAKEADLVILMAGLVASEGADLPSPNMLNDQNQMLTELLDVNQHTVVVMKDSSPVMMPWITKAKAVLEAWNQGTEDGHVVADLLFGVVNPSGKVPTTYAASENDLIYAGHPERYPGTDEGNGFPVIRYSEGLNMGYRWFQSQGIKPLFPFGFGLSYTSFELSEFSVTPAQVDGKSPITVKVTVTNTGKVAGAEVVQVYLGIPVTGQPPKRLVGFQKVFLEPEQSHEATITIDPSATNHPMSVWDYCEHDFVVKPGEYTVYLGTSSEDTPFEATLVVS